jgi:FkbM family methyltransferase
MRSLLIEDGLFKFIYNLIKRTIKENKRQEAIFQLLGHFSATMPPSLQHFMSSTSADGMRIFFRPLVFGDLQVVFTEYEKHISKIFNPKSGDVVLDVGAYIGYPYTLKSAKLVGDHGKVISIEPDPWNFRILTMNVKSNRLSNVILLNVAISDKDGESSFYVRKRPMVSRTQIPQNPSDVYRVIKVKTRSIDSILEQYNIPKVDWIKIDVEGAEMLVLKGARRLLSSKVNIVLESYPPNRGEVVRYLLNRHFKIKPLSACELFAYK